MPGDVPGEVPARQPAVSSTRLPRTLRWVIRSNASLTCFRGTAASIGTVSWPFVSASSALRMPALMASSDPSRPAWPRGAERPADGPDVGAGLVLPGNLRLYLDWLEADLFDIARQLDLSWDFIAAIIGIPGRRGAGSSAGAARAARSTIAAPAYVLGSHTGRPGVALVAEDQPSARSSAFLDQRHEDLVESLTELAMTLTEDESICDTVQSILALALRLVPGCHAVSAAALDEKSSPSTFAATDEATHELDRCQYLLQDGPCLDAAPRQQVNRWTRRDVEQRWPESSGMAGRWECAVTSPRVLASKGVRSGP